MAMFSWCISPTIPPLLPSSQQSDSPPPCCCKPTQVVSTIVLSLSLNQHCAGNTCVTGYQVTLIHWLESQTAAWHQLTLQTQDSVTTLLISPFTDSSRPVSGPLPGISHMRVEPVQGCCPSQHPTLTLTDSSRKVKIVTFHPPLTLSVIYSPNLFLHLKPQVKQTHLCI